MIDESHSTTAEAASDVRAVATQDVIAEAGKRPLLQVGEMHDRGLGMVIGGIIVYALTRAFALELDAGQAITAGAAGGGLGTLVGSKIPEAYREWIRYAALLAAALLGISVGGTT